MRVKWHLGRVEFEAYFLILADGLMEDLVPGVGVDGPVDDARPVADAALELGLGVEQRPTQQRLLQLVPLRLLVLLQLHLAHLLTNQFNHVKPSKTQ